MKILNLGCGTKTCAINGVINLDRTIYLRLKQSKLLSSLATRYLKGKQLQRFSEISGEIMIHDLRKGIPFSNDSIDVVYHSHMFEHFDKSEAKEFLLEVKRVLKPGGIQRIVVPDLEVACQKYIEHISVCLNNPDEGKLHDRYIAEFLDQAVRKEAYSTAFQKPLRRYVENLVLGDARRRRETHQWMYDRVNLSILLEQCGFNDIETHQFNTSKIDYWNNFGLDIDDQGNQYKEDSLYIEAVK